MAGDPREEREYQTRRERTDPQLVAVEWKIVDFDETVSVGECSAHAITQYPTANGPCRADKYTLDHRVEMLLAAMGGGWQTRDEAITAAARHLGFRRTGPAIRAAFKSAINAALPAAGSI